MYSCTDDVSNWEQRYNICSIKANEGNESGFLHIGIINFPKVAKIAKLYHDQ